MGRTSSRSLVARVIISALALISSSSLLAKSPDIDLNGDHKADLAVTRNMGGALAWYVLLSTTNQLRANQFGLSASDFEVQGDYDGDGATDIAVWRTTGSPTFYVLSSQTGGFIYQQWGLASDIPTALDVH